MPRYGDGLWCYGVGQVLTRKGKGMNREDIIRNMQREMHAFEKGSPKRIHHFTKVHSFARQIGQWEQLDEDTQFLLEVTAVLHDIGIRPSKEKYGYCDGKTQEEMGPPLARTLLEKYEVTEEEIQRVCYLIAHHHTYDNVDGLDYRILLEADFLVNLYENKTPEEGVLSAYEKIFVTDAGRSLCKTMFDFEEPKS